MVARELARILGAEFVVRGDEDKEIIGGYAGDFLSFVMGRAPEGAAWFTVMSNINVAAVALLTGVAAVVLCEGAKAEPPLVERCQREGIILMETPLDIFSAVREFVKSDK